MQLSILSEEDDLVHVQITGKITQENIGIAGDPLLDLLGAGVYDRNVLLNMSKADFVDSSGVSWLLTLHKHFKDGAGQMILHSIPQLIMNVFKVLNMHLVFQIAETQQQAVKMVRENVA
jgi:anti-anti-sigma factor